MCPRASGTYALVALVGLATACDNPLQTEDSAPISLAIVSGGDQTGAVGQELPERLVVRVTQQLGKYTVPVPRHLVNFRVLNGGGSMFAGAALTDLNGVAQDYLTLGSAPGVNTVEVRSVNPTTGEKQVFATFTAFGVIPGPEVCNGVDDNLDRTVDDPTWRFCIGGQPAPNTDGMNACNADYINLNGNVGDGCERLVGGQWTLSPIPTMHCPGFPPGFTSVRVKSVRVTAISHTEIRIGLHADFGWTEIANWVSLAMPVIPVGETFGGNTPFSFTNVDFANGLTASGSGTATVSGVFSGPTIFQATVGLTLDITVSGIPLVGSANGGCEDLNVTVTGTRTSP